MMKKLTALTGVVLLLSGCAGQPTSEVSANTPSPVASTPTAEEAFLVEFRATNPDADRATDQQWLDVAQSVCDAYKAGASPNQVVDNMQGTSVDADEAASLVVLSAEYLCPEYAAG